MKKITKIALTPEQFEQNVNYIKANFKTEDGFAYPTNDERSAGYIVQSNNFTLTDVNGNLTMFYRTDYKTMWKEH